VDTKFWKEKRVVVFGGAGMIGSTVVNLLVRNGAMVTVVDAMLPLYGGNLFNLEEVKDKIVFVQGDIRDEELVRRSVRDKEIVFNFAAQVSYVRSNREPFLDLDINCKGTLNILESCKKDNPYAKILFASSRFVYGTIEYNPVDEKHPFNCLSIYGIHKLASEKYHIFYHSAYGLDTVCLRISNPYGPRQQMKHNEWGIVNWFVRLAMEKKPLTVYGSGSQSRDYIYVEDIAKAFISAAESPKTKGSIYNVGIGKGRSFIDMAKIIAKNIEGTLIDQVEWPKDRYFVETGDYIANIKRIVEDTNWQPEIDLEEGIRRTVDYYQKYKEYYWK
jgi:nucleoside-diphosphate-sugar epimerase